jgi:hypothetical protein
VTWNLFLKPTKQKKKKEKRKDIRQNIETKNKTSKKKFLKKEESYKGKQNNPNLNFFFFDDYNVSYEYAYLGQGEATPINGTFTILSEAS